MISKQEIAEAQKVWAEGIVQIGKAKDQGEQHQLVAKEFLQRNYAFDTNSGCLFKPTKASQFPFRNDLKSALSYFVGNDSDFTEDSGFALQPWTNVEFKNSGYQLFEDNAIVMGEYVFTAKSGEKVKVEYTFGYIKSDLGSLKINLHHSSIPFSPSVS